MTISEFFGTLQQSVIETWRMHLQTSNHPEHETLRDYYYQMLHDVDRLIEAWQGNHEIVKNYTNIVGSNGRTSLSYLKEIYDVVKEGRKLMEGDTGLESICDDMIEFIESTIYKINQFNSNLALKESLSEYVKSQVVID